MDNFIKDIFEKALEKYNFQVELYTIDKLSNEPRFLNYTFKGVQSLTEILSYIFTHDIKTIKVYELLNND